jgi:hypothetical protein
MNRINLPLTAKTVDRLSISLTRSSTTDSVSAIGFRIAIDKEIAHPATIFPSLDCTSVTCQTWLRHAPPISESTYRGF